MALHLVRKNFGTFEKRAPGVSFIIGHECFLVAKGFFNSALEDCSCEIKNKNRFLTTPYQGSCFRSVHAPVGNGNFFLNFHLLTTFRDRQRNTFDTSGFDCVVRTLISEHGQRWNAFFPRYV